MTVTTRTDPSPRRSRSDIIAAERLAAATAAYIDEIAALRKEADSGRDPAPLLLALGCCEVELRRGKGWCFDRPKPPAPVHETLIVSTLTAFLHAHVTHRLPADRYAVSLLDGLQQNDRWRELVTTVDGANDFASLLAQITATIWSGWTGEHSEATPKTKDDFTRALRIRMLPIITDITNNWIAPRKLAGNVTPKTLLGALFGEAWYSLLLEADEADFRSWDIRKTIMDASPVFYPGLVLEQPESLALCLPALSQP